MLVVVDSNLLFGSLTASRPAQEWQRLLELSSEGSIELVLPEVVHWELVNQLRENLTRKAERYRKLGDDLRRAGLAPSNSGAFEGQLSEVVADTGEGFRQTLLLHRGRIAPLPDVGAAQLVRRSLERQPPFDAEDRGMRDTLIWLTVLELIRAGDDVVLASGDTRAFGDGTLGTALAAEGRDAAGRCSPVTLARSLQQTLDLIVQRTSAAFTAAKAAILDDDEVVSTVIAELSAGADSYIVEGAGLLRQGWSEQLAGFRIDEVVDWGSLVIDRASCDDDDGVQATVTLSAIADLDVRSSLLEFHEFEALTNRARVDDVAVGMLDGLEQTLMRRDVLIVGDVVLSRASPSPIVRVTDVVLQPHPPRSGQLALEMRP
jgi:hypothetical protein